jgi:hypothetical protein
MNSSQKLLTFAASPSVRQAASDLLLNSARTSHEPEVPAGTHVPEPERKPEQAKPATSASRTAPARVEEPTRTEVSPRRAGSEFPQGIKGRVRRPVGASRSSRRRSS